jgi:hypothetical protein
VTLIWPDALAPAPVAPTPTTSAGAPPDEVPPRSDEVRGQLRRLVRQYPEIARDPRLCRALLRDAWDGAVLESSVLTRAVEDGLVEELRTELLGGGAPSEAWAARLESRHGLRPELARWAVDSWRFALRDDPSDPPTAASPVPAIPTAPSPPPAEAAPVPPPPGRGTPAPAIVPSFALPPPTPVAGTGAPVGHRPGAAPPPPPPPPSAPGGRGTVPVCPTCRQPGRFVPAYGRYYCDRCRRGI